MEHNSPAIYCAESDIRFVHLSVCIVYYTLSSDASEDAIILNYQFKTKLLQQELSYKPLTIVRIGQIQASGPAIKYAPVVQSDHTVHLVKRYQAIDLNGSI